MWFPRNVFIQRDSEIIERDNPFDFYAIYKEIWDYPRNIFLGRMEYH